MSRETHYRFLEKAALKEAQKAFGKRGRSGARFEDFVALRVQTVEPWKRVVAMLIGCAILGFAAWAFFEGFNIWAVVAFGVFGSLCIVVGLIGWKRQVEAVFDATADVLFQKLLDALF